MDARHRIVPKTLIDKIPPHLAGTDQEPPLLEALIYATDLPVVRKVYVRLHVTVDFLILPTQASISLRIQTLRMRDVAMHPTPSSCLSRISQTFPLGLLGPQETIILLVDALDKAAVRQTLGLTFIHLGSFASSLPGHPEADTLDFEIEDDDAVVAVAHVRAEVQPISNFALYDAAGIFAAAGPQSALLSAIRSELSASEDTVTQILNCMRSAIPLDEVGNVLDLGDGRVVKRTYRVTETEAIATEFVRRSTAVPVPRVHMYFEHEGRGHIVMDKVDGVPLSSCKRDLSNDEWLKIVDQLAAYVADLQRCSRFGPTGVIGAWPTGPFFNVHFDPPPRSSWQFCEEFWTYFLRRPRLRQYRPTPVPNLLTNESRVVLSHGDLQPKNIMVKDARIVGIIDWETLGYYPDVWEWGILLMGLPNHVSHMVPPSIARADAFVPYMYSVIFAMYN